MRWFKHPTNLRNQETGAAVREKFKLSGFGLLCMLFEITAENMDGSDCYSVTFPKKFLARTCGISVRKLEEFADFLANSPDISLKIYGDQITIECPILKKLRDEYTTKKQRKYETCPDISYEVSKKNRTDAELHTQQMKNKEKAAHCISDEAQRLAELLLTRIIAWKPDFRRPAAPELRRWAEDIQRILSVDNRNPAQIQDVIIHATTDTFWQPHILSGQKLRLKLDTLEAQMRRIGSKNNIPLRHTKLDRERDALRRFLFHNPKLKEDT